MGLGTGQRTNELSYPMSQVSQVSQVSHPVVGGGEEAIDGVKGW